MIVEICEENVVVGCDVAGGAVALSTPYCKLIQAANYTRDGTPTKPLQVGV